MRFLIDRQCRLYRSVTACCRESRLTQLVRESLCGGTSGCYACMIAHVSSYEHSYNETLQVVQLAAKLFRLRVRRKNKVSLMLITTDFTSSDVQSNAKLKIQLYQCICCMARSKWKNRISDRVNRLRKDDSKKTHRFICQNLADDIYNCIQK